MRQIFGEIGWEKKLLVFFIALTILTLLGPFGTYEELDIWRRSVFWVIIVGGVGFCMHITMSVSLATSALGRLQQIPRLFIGAAAGAFPGAAIVIFVNGVFRPPLVSADAMPMIWIQVTIIGFLIGVIEYIDWRNSRNGVSDEPAIRTKLHDRLRAELSDTILSMSMQDHYVEVKTSAGKELVLMRFTDALKEVENIPGARLHRSHWVAVDHISNVEKRGTRSFAILLDGSELPVSDTYASEVTTLLGTKPLGPQSVN